MKINSNFLRFCVALLSFANILCFTPKFSTRWISSQSTFLKASTTPSGTWQEDVDKILDIDTTCKSRRDTSADLLRKIGDVGKDLSEALKERNIEKIAPPNLTYGKNLKGVQAFQKQLTTDIIPELLTQTLPKLASEAPNLAKELINKGPSKLRKQSEDFLELINDIRSDPSALQATVDEAKTEFKNIFKSTPVGLYTPRYDVVKTTSNYEIRNYDKYSVCSTVMSSAKKEDDILSSSDSFNVLAKYIFGDNAKVDGKSEKMSMTTPVITYNGKMEFVLPPSFDSSSAPVPVSEKVFIEDVSADTFAVREFAGFATEKEISKQRALLEDALLADGIVYDNLSFKTFQYNPPQTLPWLRRNEVCLKVSVTIPPEIVYESTPPEAGD